MGIFRAVSRASCLVLGYMIFGLVGAVLRLLFFWNKKRRHYWVLFFARWWGRYSCFVFNIRIRVEGDVRIAPGSLIVPNHVGTPDIFVMSSCFPAFFVSKAEIGQWPLFSWLARLGATLFVDRSRRHQVKATISEIRERLEEGASVVLFAEGRASDGQGVLPFKTPHFEAAALAGAPVVPVAVKYHDGNTPSIACWTDTSFFDHILALLKNRTLEGTVFILPEIRGETDRRVLAEKSYRMICEKHLSMG